MFVVGVTGGIGCGKSTVTDMFSELGVDIVDADLISRDSVNVGSTCLSKLAEHFSDHILLPDGNLNREKLREIIFNNSTEKDYVEGVIHPFVREEILSQLKASSSKYTILSSPLLFETKQTALTHRDLVVDIPVKLQVSRTQKRDRISEELISCIIESQSNRQFKLEKADDVIDNSGSLEQTHKQVLELHKVYLSLA